MLPDSNLNQAMKNSSNCPACGTPLAQGSPGKSCWLMHLALLCRLTQPLAAAQFDNFTYTDSGTEITIDAYQDDGSDSVAIPASIVGKPVTRIGERVFEQCYELTCVTIPTSVTSIGMAAFGACSRLESITTPPIDLTGTPSNPPSSAKARPSSAPTPPRPRRSGITGSGEIDATIRHPIDP